MKVRHIMTVDVATVEPDRSVTDVIALFAQRTINGAPVVSDGQLIGIVTTTDLMRAWDDEGATVGDVMSRDVLTLTEEMTVAEATRVLARAGLHRAPVVRGADVVGMLTRTDLLRPYMRTDAEIHADLEEVVSHSLGLGHRTLHVRVLDGVVFLEGAVPGRCEHELLVRLVRSTPGVVDVVDRIAAAPATVGIPDR